MAPKTIDINRMDDTDRKVLDLYKEGVGVRTIAMRIEREHAEVADTVETLCGSDRSRAAAVLAAYDKRHDTTPAGAPTAGGTKPVSDGRTTTERTTTARRPAKPASAAVAEPAAPEVVPVDLTGPTPVDVPVTALDAGPAGPRAEDLPLERPPAPTTTPAEQQPPAPAGADLRRTAELLAGPTEPLPAVGSFDELMAAVAGVPELAEIAGRATALVDQLHDRYDRERQARTVRAEATDLCRRLDAQLAQLALLAKPAN